MISGDKSNQETLSGKIVAIMPLKGTISINNGLLGSLSVSVKNVPYYETSNEQGGTTVYIGKELTNHGI